jgi:hypothetical protein
MTSVLRYSAAKQMFRCIRSYRVFHYIRLYRVFHYIRSYRVFHCIRSYRVLPEHPHCITVVLSAYSSEIPPSSSEKKQSYFYLIMAPIQIRSEILNVCLR